MNAVWSGLVTTQRLFWKSVIQDVSADSNATQALSLPVGLMNGVAGIAIKSKMMVRWIVFY